MLLILISRKSLRPGIICRYIHYLITPTFFKAKRCGQI